MEEKRNYLKDYYSKEEHNLRELVENIDIDKEESIKEYKSEIAKIQKQLEQKKEELSKEVEKVYSKQYSSISNKIILHYRGRGYDNYYFDLVSGLESNDYNNENNNIYNINTKRGEVEVVVGYDYDLASIIIKKYSYNISKDNDRITTKFLEEKVISFMENKGVKFYTDSLNESHIEDIINVSNYTYASVLDSVKDNEFINTFYGVDYKGHLSLRRLRECNLKNKSFEIIIKTCPLEIIDNLLDMELKETLPIYRILDIQQDTYNNAIEKGVVKELYENLSMIKKNVINKTEKEWVDFIEEMKHYEEDLLFYNIDYSSNYYYYNRDNNSLANVIIQNYTENEILRKYYSLGKFANYVVNETINQGYSRIRDFISELRDYLTMCESDNIKATLYSSYLKQTHDITSRNHKVKVEKENEEIFKSRYKDFKNYYNNVKGYMVIAPKDSEDLKREGDNLNHCVASYIKRVIDNECLILFLRKNKEESLITLEVRHNTICQVRGMHNRRATNVEVEVLKDFAKCRGLETNF